MNTIMCSFPFFKQYSFTWIKSTKHFNKIPMSF